MFAINEFSQAVCIILLTDQDYYRFHYRLCILLCIHLRFIRTLIFYCKIRPWLFINGEQSWPDVQPMLVQCWASVANDGQTLKYSWLKAFISPVWPFACPLSDQTRPGLLSPSLSLVNLSSSSLPDTINPLCLYIALNFSQRGLRLLTHFRSEEIISTGWSSWQLFVNIALHCIAPHCSALHCIALH